MKKNNFSEPFMPVASQFSKERDYWLNKLSGHLEKVGFPPTNKKPGKSTEPKRSKPSNKTVKFKLPGELLSRLMKVAGGSDARLHVILTAGIVLLLNKYTYNSTDDIIVGVPIYRQEVQGRLVNTVLALRIRLGEAMTFKDLLLQVSRALMEAVENQNYPIHALLYHLGMSPGQKEFPLFEVAVLLENIHDPGYLRDINPGMVFSFGRTGETLNGVAGYDSLKYEKSKVEKITHHLICLLQNALSDVNAKISVIDQLSEEEKGQLLIDSSHTGVGYPRERAIHRLFEEQAEKTPGNIAVTGASLSTRWDISLTYKELNEKTNRLAKILTGKGVKPDTIVAIIMDRFIEMMVGILGILKAGGAYLPIDPDYPEQRIQFMLSDSKPKALVTVSPSRPRHEEDGKRERWEGEIVFLSSPLSNSLLERGDPQRQGVSKPVPGTCLAYVIYTSGTTGKPKGVLIEHKNLVRLLFNDEFAFDFGGDDVWTMFHSPCFDFSVWEMYGALLYGGKLIVIPRMTARETSGFLEVLREESVTVLNQTPSAFYALINAELGNPRKHRLNLKYVILGGEALTPGKLSMWKEMYPTTRLINMYGLTETTVHVTYKEIKEEDIHLNISNIGKPIPTLSTIILDKNLALLPAGAAGELCVGGEGVGRGYLNRPELTHEKFDQDLWYYQDYHDGYHRSYRSYKSYTIYRTGDLVRSLPNGEMEYLGRIDHQVKIRGYRIELGEIENRLLNHEAVKDTVVIAREDERGEKYLCAYIVPQKEKTVDRSELRTELAGSLPDFMVPSYFVEMEALPLTPNGKINTRALPEPGISCGKTLIPTRDEIEVTLLQIWSEILITKKETKQFIGIDSDFFLLGGHSMTATILINRINQAFNVKVPLSEIFTSSTIRELAEYIRGASGKKFQSVESVEKRDYYTLSSAQKRLYVLQKTHTTATHYNVPAMAILEGELDKERLEKIFQELARRHESLRTSFHMVLGEPVQRVHDEVEIKVEMPEFNIKNFIRPFDLSQSPLMRVGLTKPGETRHLLLVEIHHIVTDGTSMDILVKEFMALYAGQELPGLRIQYKDFSGWQNNLFESAEIKRQEEYWLQEFAQEPPVLNLPLDYPRSAKRSVEGSVVSFELDGKETAVLKKLALDEEVTLYMVLLVLYNILLSKVSRQEDIVIGTSIAGRRHADLEPLIGIFINTLALRNRPSGEKTFKEFLKEVGERTLEAFKNQDYPFEDLVEKAAPHRDASRNPLFDVRFSFHNEARIDDISEIELPGLKLVPYKTENHTSKSDITLQGIEIGDKLCFTFEYCTKLFKRATIERLVKYFKEIVDYVKENKDTKLKDMRITHELVAIKTDVSEIDLEF